MNQEFNNDAQRKAAEAFLKKKGNKLSLGHILVGIEERNPILISKAITLVESSKANDQDLAAKLLNKLPKKDNTRRIGITGPPGVGKSTFIEAFGLYLIAQGFKIAVLSIDPSSQVTKGSILGDKTRMEKLSMHTNAFIRPSPAGSALGGVAAGTKESISVLEAAGFDIILVETVGVGQSELDIHSMVDCFLLLLLPGGGDELQGIKKGVVEMADLLVINKSDGENKQIAKQTRASYKSALHLFAQNASEWNPPVLEISALEKNGIEELWTTIDKFFEKMIENGEFQSRRLEQSMNWFEKNVQTQIINQLKRNPDFQKSIEEQLALIKNDGKSSFSAAQAIIKLFLKD